MSDLRSDVLMGTDWAKPTTRYIVILDCDLYPYLSHPILLWYSFLSVMSYLLLLAPFRFSFHAPLHFWRCNVVGLLLYSFLSVMSYLLLLFKISDSHFMHPFTSGDAMLLVSFCFSFYP
jgi:hypothetical protein